MIVLMVVTLVMGVLLYFLLDDMASGGESEQMIPFEFLAIPITALALIVELVVWLIKIALK